MPAPAPAPAPVHRANHTGASPHDAQHLALGGDGLASLAGVSEHELATAQAQLDALSAQLFGVGVDAHVSAPPATTLPPFSVPWSSAPPPASLPGFPPSIYGHGHVVTPADFSTPAYLLPEHAFPGVSAMPAELTTAPTPATASSRARAKGKAKAEAERESVSDDEDDKRRRNTEASARFRAKKKQRDLQLQETSLQLRDRVTVLEKEASSLKAENQWLRDLISEKTVMEPKNSG
ncbi:regulatory protein cys-3, transcription factor [Pseudohyphozyma bogoriensis]|nr:regulatory protein cys-3, transcription factor [Pseudohyphozyma bogoriensis]